MVNSFLLTIDLSSFITWFINITLNLILWAYNTLDSIQLSNGVSLLDFVITIFIIGIVIPVLVAIPNNASRVESRAEHKKSKSSNKWEEAN